MGEACSPSRGPFVRKGTDSQERLLPLGGETYRARVIRWGHKGWPGAPGWSLSQGQQMGNNTPAHEAASYRVGCQEANNPFLSSAQASPGP